MGRKNRQQLLPGRSVRFKMPRSILFGAFIIPSPDLVIARVDSYFFIQFRIKSKHNALTTRMKFLRQQAGHTRVTQPDKSADPACICTPESKSGDIQLSVAGTYGAFHGWGRV